MKTFHTHIRKRILQLSMLFVISLFVDGCKESNATVITGMVDTTADLILVGNPDLNVSYPGFVDTVMLEKDGTFKLKFNLKDPSFIIIDIPAHKRKYILPIQQGQNYHVVIGENNELDIEGLNEDGIKLYQSVLQYEPGKMKWSHFNNDSFNRDEIIAQTKQEELDQFKKLLEEKKITKSFYRLVENDRHCFYGFVSSWLSSWDLLELCRTEKTDNDEKEKKKIIDRLAGIFDKDSPNDTQIMKSPSWDRYALLMYIEIYTQFANKKVGKDNIEELLSEQHIPFWFEQIKANFTGNNKEALLAVFLHKTGAQDPGASEFIIPVFEYFKEHFPKSSYLPYFEHQLNETISFYQGEPFDHSIHFIEETDSINSFVELVSQLKGKKLYVDVWATWCNPCREQFQYHDSLEIILQENDITLLYISLDEDNQAKRWKAMIYAYNLKGFHYRANQSVIDDLNKLYQDENEGYGNGEKKRSFTIPWYMLIDENGNILEKQFKRPSVIVTDKSLFD